jgi:hypothetical protein
MGSLSRIPTAFYPCGLQPSPIDFLASLPAGDPYFKSSLSTVPGKYTIPDVMRQSTSGEEESLWLFQKPKAHYRVDRSSPFGATLKN